MGSADTAPPMMLRCRACAAPSLPSSEVPADACGRVADHICRHCCKSSPGTAGGAGPSAGCLRGGARPWGKRNRHAALGAGGKSGLSCSGFLSTDNGSAQEFRITETKATSERSERLANLLILSSEPMLAWNLDGSIEFWNAGSERLYGFAPNEAVGRISHALLQTKFPI